MNEAEIAARCIAILSAEDSVVRELGIEILESGPDYVHLRMTVRPDMANVHGACHGGTLFTLADEALFYACHTNNQKLVTAGASIDFLAAARVGDVLHAHGRCRRRGRSRGLGDVEISREDGSLIAVSRGNYATIPGSLF